MRFYVSGFSASAAFGVPFGGSFSGVPFGTLPRARTRKTAAKIELFWTISRPIFDYLVPSAAYCSSRVTMDLVGRVILRRLFLMEMSLRATGATFEGFSKVLWSVMSAQVRMVPTALVASTP